MVSDILSEKMATLLMTFPLRAGSNSVGAKADARSSGVSGSIWFSVSAESIFEGKYWFVGVGFKC